MIFSISVPVYGHAEFLPHTLKSIRCQAVEVELAVLGPFIEMRKISAKGLRRVEREFRAFNSSSHEYSSMGTVKRPVS